MPGKHVSHLMKSILVVTVVSLFVVSGQPCFAQTWKTVQTAPAVNFRDCCFLPDGQTGWAVGSSGSGTDRITVVLHTTDGFATWETKLFPYAANTSLQGIFFISADVGWVVGSSGKIYATTDGAQHWTPQASGTMRTLQKVSFVSETEGWIGGGNNDGNSYVILRTQNGGATWEDQSFGSTNYSVEDIVFVDALHGWIGGMDYMGYRHIHHTDDGGLSWTRQTVPPTVFGDVSSIDFANTQEGWASTSSLYDSPMGAVLHTTDGGLHWTTQTYTNMPYNYALDVQDDSRVAVAAMNLLSDQAKAFVTGDGGDTWQNRYLPYVAYTYGIQYVDDTIVVAANNGRIVRSLDNGLEWMWVYNSPTWRSLVWADNQNGWAVSGSQVHTDGYCYRTTDGGLTWQVDPNAPGGMKALFVDPDHGWMLWGGDGASVWRTTDGGNAWTQHPVGATSWIEDFFFADPDHGWCHGGNGTIRATSDGGVTWSTQTSGESDFIQTMFFVDADEGWAAGGYGGGSGFILYTDDGGVTWNHQTPAATNHFQVSCFLDNQRGWLVSYLGNVHQTTNGGRNWQIVGSVPREFFDSLYMTDDQNGWLAGRNASSDDGWGYIYRTTDGGMTWTEDWAAEWEQSGIFSLSYNQDGNLWACGAHGTLLQYELSTGVFEVPALTGLLHQNRPNPFNPKTVISFEIPAASPVILTVHSLAGNQIATLVNRHLESGYHEVAWDGRDLAGRPVASGAYLYRIDAGGQVETRSMVLVR